MSVYDQSQDSKPSDRFFVGRSYVHAARGETYKIIAVVWLGDTDEWGFMHRKVSADQSLGDPYFIRSVANFFGLRQGTPRFVSA